MDLNIQDSQVQNVQEESSLSIFKSLESIQLRRQFFIEHPHMIPTSLDPKIESYFTNKQRKNRLKMFLYLTDPARKISMDDIVVKNA